VGQEAGISFGITPFTYWLTLTALITFRAEWSPGGHHLEGAVVDALLADPDPSLAGGAQLAAAALHGLPRLGPKHHDVAEAMRLEAPGRVERAPAGAPRAGEADVALVDVQQDADHARALQRGDLRAGVVVAKDLPVALARAGVAVGAVLAHPHAVAEPASLDHPGDARRRGHGEGGGRESGRGGEKEQEVSWAPSHFPRNNFSVSK